MTAGVQIGDWRVVLFHGRLVIAHPRHRPITVDPKGNVEVVQPALATNTLPDAETPTRKKPG